MSVLGDESVYARRWKRLKMLDDRSLYVVTCMTTGALYLYSHGLPRFQLSVAFSPAESYGVGARPSNSHLPSGLALLTTGQSLYVCMCGMV